MIPDWQLPNGVDRGLWDYLHSEEMVAGYDAAMNESFLARVDITFCREQFAQPGRIIDLGCGTGRLAEALCPLGFEYVGVDLSDEMLKAARHRAIPNAEFVNANLIDLKPFADHNFDCAACLFSTLGMIRGEENRLLALQSMLRVLKPGGRLVLHVHNRWCRTLGVRRWFKSDFTMPQAYGGAPLTIHHFTRVSITRLLKRVGFEVQTIKPISDSADWLLTVRWPQSFRAYGYLIAADKS